MYTVAIPKDDIITSPITTAVRTQRILDDMYIALTRATRNRSISFPAGVVETPPATGRSAAFSDSPFSDSPVRHRALWSDARGYRPGAFHRPPESRSAWLRSPPHRYRRRDACRSVDVSTICWAEASTARKAIPQIAKAPKHVRKVCLRSIPDHARTRSGTASNHADRLSSSWSSFVPISPVETCVQPSCMMSPVR